MNIRCHELQEMLVAFLRRELPAEQNAAARAHLETCEACRALLRDVEDLLERVHQLPGSPPSPEFVARVMKLIDEVTDSTSASQRLKRAAEPILHGEPPPAPGDALEDAGEDARKNALEDAWEDVPLSGVVDALLGEMDEASARALLSSTDQGTRRVRDHVQRLFHLARSLPEATPSAGFTRRVLQRVSSGPPPVPAPEPGEAADVPDGVESSSRAPSGSAGIFGRASSARLRVAMLRVSENKVQEYVEAHTARGRARRAFRALARSVRKTPYVAAALALHAVLIGGWMAMSVRRVESPTPGLTRVDFAEAVERVTVSAYRDIPPRPAAAGREGFPALDAAREVRLPPLETTRVLVDRPAGDLPAPPVDRPLTRFSPLRPAIPRTRRTFSARPAPPWVSARRKALAAMADTTRRRVGRGIAYLNSVQRADGSYPADQPRGTAETTSLAALGLLGVLQHTSFVDSGAKDAANINNAVRWLLGAVDGAAIRGMGAPDSRAQALLVLALSENYVLARESGASEKELRRLVSELGYRRRLREAVMALCGLQNPDGGWAPRAGSLRSDLVDSYFAALALTVADQSGLLGAYPFAARYSAVAGFLARMTEPDGRAYLTRSDFEVISAGPHGGKQAIAASASLGLLLRARGVSLHPGMSPEDRRALLERQCTLLTTDASGAPLVPTYIGPEIDQLFWMLTAGVLPAGERSRVFYKNTWLPALRTNVLENDSDGDGSWAAPGQGRNPRAEAYGRAYITALTLLAAESPARRYW